MKRREAPACAAPGQDVEEVLDGVGDTRGVRPVGLVHGDPGRGEDPAHVRHRPVGAVTDAVERIDEDRTRDAEPIAQLACVPELLCHGGVMRIELARVRLVGGQEVLKSFSDGASKRECSQRLRCVDSRFAYPRRRDCSVSSRFAVAWRTGLVHSVLMPVILRVHGFTRHM